MDLTELAVLVEQVSRRYADRFDIDRTPDWFFLKLQEEVGELTQAYLIREGQARPKDGGAADHDQQLAAELADVVCHALLIAHRFGIDVQSAIATKWLSRL